MEMVHELQIILKLSQVTTYFASIQLSVILIGGDIIWISGKIE